MKTYVRARFQPAFTVALVLGFNLACFFAARLAMLSFLWKDIQESSHIPEALYIGLKFDARYAVFLTLPVALCLLIPALERRLAAGKFFTRAVLGLEALLFTAALLIYCLDFGFFFYLHQRLDITALDFIKDPLISATMLWQSYPVPALILAFVACIFAWLMVVRALVKRHKPVPLCPRPVPAGAQSRWQRAGVIVACLAVLFVMGYGQISSNLFPLRWSNAYFSADNNISLLALNPIQNLYDTRRTTQAGLPDVDAVREAYPRMAAWLGFEPKPETLSFVRSYPGAPASNSALGTKPGEQPNIVIILMESLAWPRTSLTDLPAAIPSPQPPAGKKLDPTPFLKELAEQSLYFSNFYAPSRTTARAIFTTITGIPDVNHTGGTTSRNPALVDQSTVFNEFKGYEKYYLIGGSASWANIRGLLLHNIGGLHLMEEESWKAPNVDVWGISDLALLRESVELFSASPKPFIAFIQTAGFHRPYTIPADNEGYVLAPAPSAEALAHYGFESAEEFQSMHFTDHALKVFFDRARKEAWFDNTIFAIFGDHGLNNSSTNVSPAYLACELQAWHIPLLLYAPGRIAPGINPNPKSQLDVLPTLAKLSGLPWATNTLGRDLLSPQPDERVFISATDSTRYLLENGYCYKHSQPSALYNLNSPTLENLLESEPERAAAMSKTLNDFYVTSKYLLYNNSKKVLEPVQP